MTFYVKYLEYCKKLYHQKQFSKDDFTWPQLIFFIAMFMAQTYYSKSKKKQIENMHGVKPSGHQGQVSKGSSLPGNHRECTLSPSNRLCVQYCLSVLQRETQCLRLVLGNAHIVSLCLVYLSFPEERQIFSKNCIVCINNLDTVKHSSFRESFPSVWEKTYHSNFRMSDKRPAGN